jgi:hypothetical protein
MNVDDDETSLSSGMSTVSNTSLEEPKEQTSETDLKRITQDTESSDDTDEALATFLQLSQYKHKIKTVNLNSDEPQPSTSSQGTNVDESVSELETLRGITFAPHCQAYLLLCKWPRMKRNVPNIFLHNPFEIDEHVPRLLNKGIKFYKLLFRQFYTKLMCYTTADYKLMRKYLHKYSIPYHTYRYPIRNTIMFAIRGLPSKTDMNYLTECLRAASIPVKRIFKLPAMRNKCVIMVALPIDTASKKLLWIQTIFGRKVTIEEPKEKVRQCYRCLRWGHSQRFCFGYVKCSSCGSNHLSSKCTADLSGFRLRCVNCTGEHQSHSRQCSFCPDSRMYKKLERDAEDLKMKELNAKTIPELVTVENVSKLYANLNFVPGRLI